MMIWNNLQTILQNNSTFLITSHESLDGDSVGCQLAMYWYLNSLGKQVTLYSSGPVPEKFNFLRNANQFSPTCPTGPFDILAVLDASNLSRLGWQGAAQMCKQIIDIDHHSDNTHFGVVNHVYPSAATGEILYDFFVDCGINFPDYVAEALYTAILTDTGGFRFSNTSARVLCICGDLVKRGANPATIHEKVYGSFSLQAMRLYSYVWSTLTFHFDGRVCVMDLPLQLLEKFGATYSDSEGMADLTTMVTGTTVGIFMKHTETQTHFSLRSKDQVNVGLLARNIPGGGGHSNAAGCTIYEPATIALPRMLEFIRAELH